MINKVLLVLIKRIFIISFVLFSPVSVLTAQVTIGSVLSPDDNALLDLKEQPDGSSSKGLLFPRVALSDITKPAPLISHVAGMTVYNTATSADTVPAQDQVTPGFYFNNGSNWERAISAASGSKMADFEISSFGSPAGSMVLQEPIIRGSVVQPIFVNVKEEGAYFIQTERVNGLRYTASGYFYPIDVENSKNNQYPSVVLLAEGTPEKIGIHTLGFEYPASALTISATVNTMKSTFYLTLTSSIDKVYSNEPYTLSVGVVNTLPGKTITYEWYENGIPISGATGADYKVAIANETPVEGRYLDQTYTYVCLVTVEDQGGQMTLPVTVTVMPPWGKGEVMLPGLEARDLGVQMTWAQAVDACEALGSGWRLPTRDNIITVCSAAAVPACMPGNSLHLGLYLIEDSAIKPGGPYSPIVVMTLIDINGSTAGLLSVSKQANAHATENKPFFCVRGY